MNDLSINFLTCKYYVTEMLNTLAEHVVVYVVLNMNSIYLLCSMTYGLLYEFIFIET